MAKRKLGIGIVVDKSAATRNGKESLDVLAPLVRARRPAVGFLGTVVAPLVIPVVVGLAILVSWVIVASHTRKQKEERVASCEESVQPANMKLDVLTLCGEPDYKRREIVNNELTDRWVWESSKGDFNVWFVDKLISSRRSDK